MKSKKTKVRYPKDKKHKQSLPKWVPGLVFFSWGVILFLSLLSFRSDNPSSNWIGLIGYALGYLSEYLFGLAAFLLPCFLMWYGAHLLINRPLPRLRLTFISFLLLLLSTTMLLAVVSSSFPHFATTFQNFVYTRVEQTGVNPFSTYEQTFLGGVPLFHLYADSPLFNFSRYLGILGSLLLFLSVWIISLFLLLHIHPSMILKKAKTFWKFFFPKRLRFATALGRQKATKQPFKGDAGAIFERPDLGSSAKKEDPTFTAPNKIFIEPPAEKKKTSPHPTPKQIPSNVSKYTLPSPTLLTEIPSIDPQELTKDLKRHAQVLEETLLSFGIEAKVGDIHCGPTITLFEVHPAIGVKVQKIKALERDIALNMQARSIRIIAPIPGKAAVGIEVPNPHPQEVSFRQMLEHYQQRERHFQIPLLLGKLVGGEDVWSDLAKMPHLIIAGATGSGKSVCINTIVMSILMNAHPEQIKLLMIDPKKVELTGYSKLPHMLTPVITEPHGAKQALAWLVKEMERRYELFRQLGIRNVIGFNTRKQNLELENSLEVDVPKKLPYIMVIIDELADLMMVSSSDIETPIARIAQMARAVGIHMVLATQRPSREVITGLIKANFPCRIAFKVASRINSQIIIDEIGSEALLGNGDMLFLPPGTSTLLRAQGAFIRDADINQVIDYVTKQAPPNYLIPSFDHYHDEGEFDESDEGEEGDSLYPHAKSLVLDTGTASTTFLQRKLKIGYARAASLMDLLEAKGIISPQEGAKPRKVFYPNKHSEDE